MKKLFLTLSAVLCTVSSLYAYDTKVTIYVGPNSKDTSYRSSDADASQYQYTVVDGSELIGAGNFNEAVTYIGQNIDNLLAARAPEYPEATWDDFYEQYRFEAWFDLDGTDDYAYAIVVFGQAEERQYRVIQLEDPDYGGEITFDDQEDRYSAWKVVPEQNTTGIHSVKANAGASVKAMQDARFVICNGARTYNAMGIEVK